MGYNFNSNMKYKASEDYALFDLHLHLDGALSSEIIIKIAKGEGIELPTYNPEELEKLLRVSDTCSSLNEYLEKFDLPNLVLQTKYGLKEATTDLLNRLASQGLKYVELRMAPQLSTAEGLSQEEVVETLLEVINNNPPLKVRLILCLMRGASKEKNMTTVEVAKKYLGKGVVAIDLAGAEALYPNTLYEEEFNKAKENNIPFTIHAGEAADYHSVDSALNMGATRIGHGIHCADSLMTIFNLGRKKIPLEVCPTSNLQTGAIVFFEDFRLKELFDTGLVITINTDNPTVSHTTLRDEYRLLSRMGFDQVDVYRIALNTLEASFLNEEEKEELKKYINE